MTRIKGQANIRRGKERVLPAACFEMFCRRIKTPFLTRASFQALIKKRCGQWAGTLHSAFFGVFDYDHS